MNLLGRAYKRRIKSKGLHFYITPIYAQARDVYSRANSLFRPIIKRSNESRLETELINGSVISYKSADKPDNLRGPTLDSATLDECGTIKSMVWQEILRPMLAVKLGPCDFGGTPKGKNWFFDLWMNAIGPDWTKIHASSLDSPYFSQEEWDDIQSKTSERVFRQEYMAEFLETDGEVFRGIQQCIKGILQEPQKGEKYIIGVDVARVFDWTVITVWDAFKKHLVYFDRFQRIPWPRQRQIISDVCKKYNNGTAIVDATGMGDPLPEDLRRMGVNVHGVQFTHATKVEMIEKLALSIEKQQISFPEIPELIHELSIYEATKTPSGLVKYSSPDGYHDDIVISMALANLMLQTAVVGSLSAGPVGMAF